MDGGGGDSISRRYYLKYNPAQNATSAKLKILSISGV